jgi:hypothetical protein
LAEEKGSLLWKSLGLAHHGCALAMTGGHALKAIEMISTGMAETTFFVILGKGAHDA